MQAGDDPQVPRPDPKENLRDAAARQRDGKEDTVP